jgi:hypothetical protein
MKLRQAYMDIQPTDKLVMDLGTSLRGGGAHRLAWTHFVKMGVAACRESTQNLGLANASPLQLPLLTAAATEEDCLTTTNDQLQDGIPL